MHRVYFSQGNAATLFDGRWRF